MTKSLNFWKVTILWHKNCGLRAKSCNFFVVDGECYIWSSLQVAAYVHEGKEKKAHSAVTHVFQCNVKKVILNYQSLLFIHSF